MSGWILPIAVLIACEGIADIISKQYSLHGGVILWAGALSGYVIANIFWLIAIRHGSGLARGAMIFSVGSALLASALGVFLYKEPVGKMEVLGIIFGVISIFILASSET
jgi:drug/metabolite transporter (DMT)-like permease